MSCTFYFISHPDVEVRPDTPVPDWPLSPTGHARMRQGLGLPWVAGIGALYASTERKARDAADHLARHLALPVHELADLGENDRSSTGYLPRAEFERLADAFFASPETSVRGWERAVDAQARIVAAATSIASRSIGHASVAIVSHGAVGTLLYCHLAGEKIDRRYDQPGNGGGNYFSYSMSPPKANTWWRALDDGVG